MPKRQHNAAYSRAFRNVMGGHVVITDQKAKAVLFVGRRAGFSNRNYNEGRRISEGTAGYAIAHRRQQQIGPKHVGVTVLPGIGYYQGKDEPTTRVEIAWIPNKREGGVPAFRRNVRKLAQAVATDLAQREIIIEWEGAGVRDHVESASPSKAPKPGDEDSPFCRWVRERSRAARQDPTDGCYIKRK